MSGRLERWLTPWRALGLAFACAAAYGSVGACAEVECVSDEGCDLHCGCCGATCGCDEPRTAEKAAEMDHDCANTKMDCSEEQARQCPDGVKTYRAVCKNFRCEAEPA